MYIFKKKNWNYNKIIIYLNLKRNKFFSFEKKNSTIRDSNIELVTLRHSFTLYRTDS